MTRTCQSPRVKEPNRSSVEYESTPRSSDLYQQESEEDNVADVAVVDPGDDIEEDCNTFSINEDVQDQEKEDKFSSHSDSASEVEEDIDD